MQKPTLGILLILLLLYAQDTAGKQPNRINDIVYARVDGQELLLDLHLPHSDDPPLVVWVHGGAWRSGSRSRMPLNFLVQKGFAVASVDYRLSGTAPFPAQIHDCKAAIRFLRTNQSQFGYDAEQIAVAGSSAGGHLAAEIGVTNGNQQLEGTIGEDTASDSSVQAIVDYYGPTNLMTILKQSTPHGLSVRVPALELLLGDRPEAKQELATLASPVFQIDPNDPPLLMIHGDQDPQVPINQSHELHAKYLANKLDVTFEVVHGGQHGGKLFFDDKRQAIVTAFLERTIKRPRVDRSTPGKE